MPVRKAPRIARAFCLPPATATTDAETVEILPRNADGAVFQSLGRGALARQVKVELAEGAYSPGCLQFVQFFE